MRQKSSWKTVLQPHHSTNHNNLRNLSRYHLFSSHINDLPTDVHAGETDRDRDQGLDLLPAIHMRIVSISLPHSHKTKCKKKDLNVPSLQKDVTTVDGKAIFAANVKNAGHKDGKDR